MKLQTRLLEDLISEEKHGRPVIARWNHEIHGCWGDGDGNLTNVTHQKS